MADFWVKRGCFLQCFGDFLTFGFCDWVSKNARVILA